MYLRAIQPRCYTCNTSSHDVRERDDGQVTCESCVNCFYGMTIHRGRHAGSYANRTQARAAVLRELHFWQSVPHLDSTAKRRRVADMILSDSRAIRPHRGMVLFAWAKDVALGAAVEIVNVA